MRRRSQRFPIQVPGAHFAHTRRTRTSRPILPRRRLFPSDGLSGSYSNKLDRNITSGLPTIRELSPISAVARLLKVVVGSHSAVSRKTFQIVVLVGLISFALAYPVIESLDHWDAPSPAADSELQAIAVLTFCAIFLVTQKLAALPVSIEIQAHLGLCFRALRNKHIVLFSPDLTASPPVALRI